MPWQSFSILNFGFGIVSDFFLQYINPWFWPDEFELILVCTKWTSSFGCFEIVSAINGLIRLFDTSSPFITPGQWFMPSNWQWVVINFVALKKIQRTHYLGWKLIPSTPARAQWTIFDIFSRKLLGQKKAILMITTLVNWTKFEVNRLPKVFEYYQKSQKICESFSFW